MIISEGEMNMNMIFRGYAMNSEGRHGGGVFLKDERECATFIFLATQSPAVHKIERQEASTFRCEEECRFFV